MSNPWFRMYHEFATDPKVQRLSEVDQRRYIMLLCMRCSNGDVTLQDEDVTFTLRISSDEWASTKRVFLDRNLIDSDNLPTAWDKRQYKSDSSAERVARHRENKKHDVTLQKQDGNAIEQNRTEQIQNRADKSASSEYSDSFLSFWSAYPKKTGKGDAWKLWVKLKPDLNAVLSALSWQTKSMQWKDGYIPNPKTYLNGRRWEDSPSREPQKPISKHEAQLNTMQQIFGGKNGTNRSPIDITPGRTIEGDGKLIPETFFGLRKPDGE